MIKKVKNSSHYLLYNLKYFAVEIMIFFGLLERKKVNTFIVGTQKGGTSALFKYLVNSRQISVAKEKELGYFSRRSINLKGDKWYEKQFFYSLLSNRDILVDATPEYLYYPYVAKEIYKYNKDAKIIIVLRDPVSRAYSHYSMFKNIPNRDNNSFERLIERWKREVPHTQPLLDLMNKDAFPSFKDLIKTEMKTSTNPNLEPSFLRRGLYFEQVKRYLDIFPIKNILILESSELKNNKINTLNEVVCFLGISNEFIKKCNFEDKHIGKYSEKINEEDKLMLKEIYAEENEKLFNLIDKKFNW